jgi:glycosyltransferase involved in cell wall biosynthesis
LKKRLLMAIEKITYAGAHIVMPNSKSMAKYKEQQGLLKRSKMRILCSGSSNGIDTDFFKPEAVEAGKEQLRRQQNIPEGALVFVFIGRLVKDKGIRELVGAFDVLSEKFPHIHLLLVGPLEQHLDPLPESTLALIEKHPQITSVGYVEDVRPWLKMSDVLCFPSYREGFPNVPMQAGAMGLGLIVSDINGCNEIVRNGENGWIIEVKNQSALEAAMTNVIENPQALEKMRAGVRHTIVERFGQQQIWSALKDVYEGR